MVQRATTRIIRVSRQTRFPPWARANAESIPMEQARSDDLGCGGAVGIVVEGDRETQERYELSRPMLRARGAMPAQ